MVQPFPVALAPSERRLLEVALATAIAAAIRQLPALQTPAVAAAREVLTDPAFGAKFALGYVEGFVSGFLDGAGLWRKEFEAMLRLVGVGTVVGVAEFFVRPLVESDPQGLLPQSKEALETLNTLRTLRPVVEWLDEMGPARAAAVLKELIPSTDEVVEMIEVAGREWLLELCGKAPDAIAMGSHCGRLFGRMALELIRADVEPFSFGLAGALESGAGIPEGATP